MLVHPECVLSVVEQTNYVGLTSGIIDFAKASDAREFIIGTEISIAEHLQYNCLDKMFYPLTKHLICPNMKSTTLVDVYCVLCNELGEGIIMDEETIVKAR